MCKEKHIIVLGLVTILFGLSLFERPSSRRPRGYPQLVSVRELPGEGEWCPAPDAALPEDNNLFAVFGNASVHAGSPQSGETGIITRPPIRTIRDKDPIYSAELWICASMK